MGLWNFKGSYGQVDRSGHLSTTVPTSVDGQKAYQFALGADYNLSKRTALYGTYAYINNKGGAGFTVGNTLNDPPGFGSVANGNSQGLEFGIRHSF
jgi:predicted porin